MRIRLRKLPAFRRESCHCLIDPISDPLSDPINDPLSDLDLEILKAVKENPGMNTVAITDTINAINPSVNRDKVKNALKRNLVDYVEHLGSKKSGGYYLKKKD